MNREKLLIIVGLLIIFGFNFYLYRAEFGALVDPNDNIFQYALIDEARNVWKQVFAGKLSPLYLLDSWNERWAEGFALTSYYSHLPQAILGLFGGYKLFVVVRTLMLIGMPLMFFFGARILGVSWLASLLVSLLSQAIFTDGLYGIDVTSYMWRGWGLSAQLMAVFFLPVAFGYAIDYLENKKNLGRAVLFNFLVASSHFGIFSLALLGYPLYWVVSIIPDLIRNQNFLKQRSRLSRDDEKGIFNRSLIFIFLSLFSLFYFIIPFFLQSEYRNYSVWDPIWKFDSWGLKQTLIWFFNGDLFDFNRLPIITLSVLFGLFIAFSGKNKLMRYFGVLFVFYFILFLGRSTFGNLMSLIPGFNEFHQHRVIVLVQYTGIFLGSWFIYQVGISMYHYLEKYQINFKFLNSNIVKTTLLVFGLLTVFYLERPLINYARDNAVWLNRANKAYLRDLPAYSRIKSKLESLPRARVYVGRPGNWGKQFTVGETPLYMTLSRDGYPTIGFLPESWSMNSDPEQFFNENDINFYNLYNVGYVIYPDQIKPPKFAHFIAKEGKYNLYQIKTTEGWFAAGISSIAVKTEKTNLLSPIKLWFESELFRLGDYPKIDFSDSVPDGQHWYIEMTDKNNWINLNDNKERNLWQANPFSADVTILDRSRQDGTILIDRQKKLVNGYSARVEVKEECKNCIVVLKQSFHPNWQVRVNGEKVKAFPVFPFYIGIPFENAESYEIVIEYKTGNLKIFMVWIEIVVFGYFLVALLKNKLKLN